MLKLALTLGCLLSGAFASLEVYYSDFMQPEPPLIIDDFSASFMQHKWNNLSMSHITAGSIFISGSQFKTRIDNAHDGVIQVSLFDYKNSTKDGFLNKNLVLQDLTLPAKCEYSYLPIPAFPLISKTLLLDNAAVFAGWTVDEMYGKLETWNIFYSGIPVSIYLDQSSVNANSNNTKESNRKKLRRFVRYDFWTPYDRTFTTTRFFNIKSGSQSPDLFKMPC